MGNDVILCKLENVIGILRACNDTDNAAAKDKIKGAAVDMLKDILTMLEPPKDDPAEDDE